MSLTRGLSQLRTSLLQAVRFHVSVDPISTTAWRGVLTRGFASTYLNKDDVTERIVNLVKNFDNIDQGKVWLVMDALWSVDVVWMLGTSVVVKWRARWRMCCSFSTTPYLFSLSLTHTLSISGDTNVGVSKGFGPGQPGHSGAGDGIGGGVCY